MIEKYTFNKDQVDTIYRFYDKSLRNIDFTFSERLDKQHKSKLYKTLYITNPFRKGTMLPDRDTPRREIFYEVKRLRNDDMKTFDEIFEKFDKDVAALGLM